MPGFLPHTIKSAEKLVLVGKIISSVLDLEKIPNFLSSVRPAILKADDGRSRVVEQVII